MGFSLTEASQAEGEIKVGAAFSAEAVLVFSDQGHSHATGLESCPCEHLGKVTTPVKECLEDWIFQQNNKTGSQTKM